MKLKYYMQTGVVALIAATTGVSCTDTWDDHYSVNARCPVLRCGKICNRREHTSFREGS